LSFYDLYGNNFINIGQENMTETRSFCLTHEVATSTLTESNRRCITSPTTFGILLIHWLFKGDNLDTIHSLQNATAIKSVPRQVQPEFDDLCDAPLLSSLDGIDGNQSPPNDALRLPCQEGAMNTSGRLAGASVQEVLKTSGFCAHNSTLPGVNPDAANRNVLAKMEPAGQTSLELLSNGWSAIRADLAGNFGDNYGLRAQIDLTGYLMLRAPAALYPSWSINSTGPPLQGDILQLGAGES
jgi:hypothetical protein